MNPLPPHEMFSLMTDESKAMYKPMFENIMLNLQAVRLGMFDTLFCETEDPKLAQRWKDVRPAIIMKFHERKLRGLDEDV